VLGRVLLLQLIGELVRGYRDNETWSLQLLNGTRIHILPTMNPDGFDEADTHCLFSQGRCRVSVLTDNIPQITSYTVGFTGFDLMGVASITPDDDVFVHLAKVYSYNHASMKQGNLCEDSGPFRDGITNGYHWYPLEGGMQDYNYVWAQCLELTLELSCCKNKRPSVR
ncbi:hypothetical protein GOODEAATRI_027961, partial [Goodea atripinnis]